MRAKKSQVSIQSVTQPPVYDFVRGRICLTILLILFGPISLANAQSSATPQRGWTFVQDNPIFFCQGSGKTGCSGGSFIGNMTPTVAGTVWVLEVQGPNNFTITSVTGGGGTWVHCPNCHVKNPSGFNVDAWYNLSGNAGENGSHLAFTLSGSAGSFISVNFLEVLPPAGSTASFDASGNTFSGSACTTCTAVGGLTLTGTDVVIQNPGGAAEGAWNAWSAPYITTANGSGIALNTTSGAAPTVKFTNPPANVEFMAIAFKSSLGTFTPPASQYSIAQVQTAQGSAAASGGGLNCSSGCNVTLPQATTAGDLLYIQGNSGQGGFMSAVTCAPVACNSGNQAPVIPSGNNSSVCQRSYNGIPGISNASLSCGYILSVPGGVTSLNVTASNSLSFTITVVEVASTIGTFALDVQGSTQITTNNATPPGQALTLTGANDVIFGAFWVNGGGDAPNYFPYLNLGWYCTGNGGTSPCNSLNYTMFNQGEMAVLLDSGPTEPAYSWVNPQNTTNLVTGVAFTTTGGSASPNPPTGLTAVVH